MHSFKLIKYTRLVQGMIVCFLLYVATSNSFANSGTLTYLMSLILALSQIGKTNTFRKEITYEHDMETKKTNSRFSI